MCTHRSAVIPGGSGVAVADSWKKIKLGGMWGAFFWCLGACPCSVVAVETVGWV